VEIYRHETAKAFLARAEAWLLDAEIERAMALHSARQASVDDSGYEKPVYWATVEDAGRIVGCVFRTPPYRVGVTRLPAAAVPLVAASLRQVYRQLPGISGAEPTASALANLWRGNATGCNVLTRQWLWSVASAEPPNDAPAGALRAATVADASLAQEWGDAAAGESGVAPLDGAFCTRLIATHGLHVWDDGTPRCMLGVVYRGMRAAALGIVYTPQELRGKRYATAAIAEWSRQVLERGERCFFYTDAANAATTVICRNLGHELVQEGVDIDFR
jgi:RimJ/RimL family protein N-acetyltransferase